MYLYIYAVLLSKPAKNMLILCQPFYWYVCCLLYLQIPIQMFWSVHIWRIITYPQRGRGVCVSRGRVCVRGLGGVCSCGRRSVIRPHRNPWARVGARVGGMAQHLGQGACFSLLICAGRGRSDPRLAALAWQSLCRRAARAAVLSSRTDLLMFSPNLIRHHLTRSDERRISRRLTAGLVQCGKRAGADWHMSSLWIFFFRASPARHPRVRHLSCRATTGAGQITCWMTVIIFRSNNSDVCRILPPSTEIICMHDVVSWIHDLVEWSVNMH